MASTKQVKAARSNVQKAQSAAKTELYELATKRDLPGRSLMRRDQLARKLDVS